MEQLRWSILQATGRIESHYAKFESQSQKVPPMPIAASEPAWKVRATHNEALERQTASLSAAFATLPGQPEAGFQPIVDQALYLQNSEKLLPLLQANPGPLLDHLNSMTDVSALAEELYLSVFSRRPTAEETAEVKDLVESDTNPADRREALQALLWGLLLSAEFRLNH